MRKPPMRKTPQPEAEENGCEMNLFGLPVINPSVPMPPVKPPKRDPQMSIDTTNPSITSAKDSSKSSVYKLSCEKIDNGFIVVEDGRKMYRPNIDGIIDQMVADLREACEELKRCKISDPSFQLEFKIIGDMFDGLLKK